jgi:FkbH-like protein
VHICDAEFIAARIGGLSAEDARLWLESKQPGSTRYLVEVAREAAQVIGSLRRAPHKVLVLDLDNTLWGGVVGDVGIEGIELGGTSPRGEAFKAFQTYILSLQQRGVLLAVCSKNEHERAIEPFRRHPEMVLREQHIVSFKANWQPKSDNLRQIAADLNLGLDSLVFVDDNPAEIDIVRNFAPAVKTILLGDDPAAYVAQLQDCRFFEPRALTAEDLVRTSQYQSEAMRQAELSSATDMPTYWKSLAMRATISDFTTIDLPRIVQLINKSNQFNLTTRRRTEADVTALMRDSRHSAFTLRLEDRFGDHGLVAIVVGSIDGECFEIDTWLMSCRVLQRQVEDETLNEIMRRARERGCNRVRGVYLPTAKNALVRDLLPNLGFIPVTDDAQRAEYELAVSTYPIKPTTIEVRRTVP